MKEREGGSSHTVRTPWHRVKQEASSDRSTPSSLFNSSLPCSMILFPQEDKQQFFDSILSQMYYGFMQFRETAQVVWLTLNTQHTMQHRLSSSDIRGFTSGAPEGLSKLWEKWPSAGIKSWKNTNICRQKNKPLRWPMSHLGLKPLLLEGFGLRCQHKNTSKLDETSCQYRTVMCWNSMCQVLLQSIHWLLYFPKNNHSITAQRQTAFKGLTSKCCLGLKAF